MKIVQVLNAMISNKAKISNVLRNDSEYFFLYDKKYKWSISKSDKNNDYYVHFYPTNKMSLEEMADFQEWQYFNDLVTFSTAELKTKEAHETFSELYQIVAGKLFGIEELFDDIIKGDPS